MGTRQDAVALELLGDSSYEPRTYLHHETDAVVFSRSLAPVITEYHQKRGGVASRERQDQTHLYERRVHLHFTQI